MVIRTDCLMEALGILADNEEMHVTFKEAAKGGLAVGLAAALGGVLLGPIGLAVGGTVGGVAAALLQEDKFRPISYVIENKMSASEKSQLASQINIFLREVDINDGVALASFICSSGQLKVQVLSILVRFFKDVMDLNVTYQPPQPTNPLYY